MSYVVRLTPFLVAYYRDKITRDELGIVIQKFFPDITARTLNRVGMLTFFGPLYGLFILSGFAMRGTLYGFDDEKPKSPVHNSIILYGKHNLSKISQALFNKFSRHFIDSLG